MFSACLPPGTGPASQHPSSVGLLGYLSGYAGPSGFGSCSTADQVLENINLSNRVVLITAGTSEIGAHAALSFYKAGAHVVLGCRSLDKGQAVLGWILQQCAPAPRQPDNITLLLCDLSSIVQAQKFAQSFLNLQLPLNILVNNAAVYSSLFSLSEDQLEQQFAINYLSHYVVTKVLLPCLAQSGSTDNNSIIINVTCSAHYVCYPPSRATNRLNLGRVDAVRAGYAYVPAHAYGFSKLCQILYTRELAARLQQESLPIKVFAVHPGITTEGLRKYGGYTPDTWAHTVKSYFAEGLAACHLLKTPAQAAATVAYAAVHACRALQPGQYLSDCNAAVPSIYARDDISGALLWEFSERTMTRCLQHSEQADNQCS